MHMRLLRLKFIYCVFLASACVPTSPATAPYSWKAITPTITPISMSWARHRPITWRHAGAKVSGLAVAFAHAAEAHAADAHVLEVRVPQEARVVFFSFVAVPVMERIASMA